MKKFFALCLSLVMALSLAACQSVGGGTTTDGAGTPAPMDMKSVYTALGKAAALPEMLELDESLMLDYCGIRSEDVNQVVVVICADSLRTDEIWLVEAVDGDAAERITGLANSRLKKKGEESITYSPEQYAVVEKAELLQYGNYIALIVSPDVQTLAQAFRQEAGM